MCIYIYIILLYIYIWVLSLNYNKHHYEFMKLHQTNEYVKQNGIADNIFVRFLRNNILRIKNMLVIRHIIPIFID